MHERVPWRQGWLWSTLVAARNIRTPWLRHSRMTPDLLSPGPAFVISDHHAG